MQRHEMWANTTQVGPNADYNRNRKKIDIERVITRSDKQALLMLGIVPSSYNNFIQYLIEEKNLLRSNLKIIPVTPNKNSVDVLFVQK